MRPWLRRANITALCVWVVVFALELRLYFREGVPFTITVIGAVLWGSVAWALVVGAGFVATYPHRGWKRLGLVLSPFAAGITYSALNLARGVDADLALGLGLAALVGTCPLVLGLREAVLWVSAGFDAEPRP